MIPSRTHKHTQLGSAAGSAVKAGGSGVERLRGSSGMFYRMCASSSYVVVGQVRSGLRDLYFFPCVRNLSRYSVPLATPNSSGMPGTT
jgi:hypothetical protein